MISAYDRMLFQAIVDTESFFNDGVRQFNTTESRSGPFVRQGKRSSSGDHIKKVTPVPIPNTVVKLFEPMIVLQVRK